MIAPDDSNVLYSPANWHVTGTRAKTVQNGAYLRFAAETDTNIVLHFDTSGLTTTPQIKYRIDGSGWTRTNIAATVTIPLPTENTWSRHVVEMIVVQIGEGTQRWTSQGTHVSLTGIDADTVRPIPERPRRILFFGDSITAGHIVNAYPYATEDDASQAWPYLASQHIDAEAGIVGVGGQGWNTSAPGGTPEFPDAYRYQWLGSVERDLAAHAYVINHGTNDGSLTVADVTDWLDDALPRFTPGAPVLIMRPFGGQHATTLAAAVTAYDNPIVRYVDTTGWWDPADNEQALHPNGYASIVDLAPELASVLREAFAETTPEPIPNPGGGGAQQNLFVNVGGEAVSARFATFAAPAPEPTYTSVYGDTPPPGTHTLYTDNGEPITLAQTFRRSTGSPIPDDANIVGGRVYLPSEAPGSTAVKIMLWEGSLDLATAPDREVTVPLNGAGWVEGIFDTPFPIPGIFTPYRIGYTFIGNPATYIYAPNFRTGAVAVSPQANGIEVTEGFSSFRSGSSGTGSPTSIDVGYGVDILID